MLIKLIRIQCLLGSIAVVVCCAGCEREPVANDSASPLTAETQGDSPIHSKQLNPVPPNRNASAGNSASPASPGRSPANPPKTGQAGADANGSSSGTKGNFESRPLFPTSNTNRQRAAENGQTLGSMLDSPDDESYFKPTPINEQAVQAAGIAKISGKYIDLYTDIRDDSPRDHVKAFDAAVENWADYFQTPVPTPKEFHVRGSLMQEKDRFLQAGLLPEDIPPFLHGYQDRGELWVYTQPGPYFTRHLVLHEGTHAFMRRMLHGAGPPWYMEGVAEYLGTHRWEKGELQLGYIIKDKEDAPYWGRVKLLQDAHEEGRVLTLQAIMQYGWNAHLEVEPYGWCWAACAFFDKHPVYQERFRKLKGNVRDRTITFSQDFIDEFTGEWSEVREQWQLFIAEMDYGYDVELASIDYIPTTELRTVGESEVNAKKGWQSSGFVLEAGQTYRVSAEGRFQVGLDSSTGQAWWCEPNGVTLKYYQGRPLGILLGAIRDETQPLETMTPLVMPVVIGQHLTFEAKTSGTLFLRLNDSPAELSDNSGSAKVEIRKVSASNEN